MRLIASSMSANTCSLTFEHLAPLRGPLDNDPAASNQAVPADGYGSEMTTSLAAGAVVPADTRSLDRGSKCARQFEHPLPFSVRPEVATSQPKVNGDLVLISSGHLQRLARRVPARS